MAVLFGDVFISPRWHLWHEWFANVVEKPEGIKPRKSVEITLVIKQLRISPESLVVYDY